MLQVNHLMVFFENALALNDFSMEIREGQMVGVVGSNSAGKTTLMNALSGLIIEMRVMEKRRGGERITIYGDILFNGEDITHMKASERVKKGIVLCRERHPIFGDTTVIGNLKTAGHMRNAREAKASIDYVFRLFPALSHLKSRKAGFMSGGEQQMLSVGMGLVAGPKILLLDEPLLGLSPLMQTTLVDAVKSLKEESGFTVLISEQFARPILPLLDYGYILENGMLALAGNGSELMENTEVKTAYFGV